MNDNILTIGSTARYGALELIRLYPKNFSMGMAAAILIHLFLIGSYFFIESISNVDVIHPGIINIDTITIKNIPPPPPINLLDGIKVPLKLPDVKPENAVPVPVVDSKISLDRTIPSQAELNSVILPEAKGTEGKIIINSGNEFGAPAEKEALPDIHKFIPREIEPTIVVSVSPEYPEVAVRSELEGSVTVAVLISKEGKPLKAAVIKSTSEIFNQTAADAAMKFVFTPAIQHKAPVMVWIAIPFSFVLKSANR